MTEQYKAFVFARPGSPKWNGIEFGHVGWGFQIAANRYIVGAVENPKGTPNCGWREMGFWSEETSDPLQRPALGVGGVASRYDIYKEIPVPQPNIANAMAAMKTVSSTDYLLFGQNCMDATYQILTAYWARILPPPQHSENYFPIAWFSHIGAPVKILSRAEAGIDIAFYEHAEFQGEVWRISENRSEIAFPDLGGWSQMITAMIVRSGVVTLYTEPNFKGDSVTLKDHYRYLFGWSRQARSLKIQSATANLSNDIRAELHPV